MTFTVRRLDQSDDRAKFHSGNIDLDRFFARYAGQNQFRHHIGTTYVAVDANNAIAGFATVAASELTATNLGKAVQKKLPSYPLPVLRLARLVVDRNARGQGVAQALLCHVFAMAHRMAHDIGCAGLVVDAKPEAMDFYRKLAFIALDVIAGQLGDRPQPLPMFLELGAIPRKTRS